MNAKELATLNRAIRRIADCRNITPEQLIAGDKSVKKNLASVLAHPLVIDVSDERAFGDGIWIYLRDGWISDALDLSTIHEDSWGECVDLLKRAAFDREQMEDRDNDAPIAK